jgi:hypothetical protein
VVKAEDSQTTGCGFKPPLWRLFFRYHSFGSKHGIKKCGKLYHYGMCCKPVNGRVDFEEFLTYEFQLLSNACICKLVS